MEGSWLPDKSKARDIVESFEEGIWKSLYKGEDSLDGKLAIISNALKMESMPLLKDEAHKVMYLCELEDIYYDIVFHAHHDY